MPSLATHRVVRSKNKEWHLCKVGTKQVLSDLSSLSIPNKLTHFLHGGLCFAAVSSYIEVWSKKALVTYLPKHNQLLQ